jgi:hypothetical protein
VAFANRGINVQTDTSQDQECMSAGGTSGLVNSYNLSYLNLKSISCDVLSLSSVRGYVVALRLSNRKKEPAYEKASSLMQKYHPLDTSDSLYERGSILLLMTEEEANREAHLHKDDLIIVPVTEYKIAVSSPSPFDLYEETSSASYVSAAISVPIHTVQFKILDEMGNPLPKTSIFAVTNTNQIVLSETSNDGVALLNVPMSANTTSFAHVSIFAELPFWNIYRSGVPVADQEFTLRKLPAIS